MTLVCWNCGTSLESIPQPISRHAQCPSCFETLHNCRLCQFHNESATGQCEDERADPPTQKESANFCEYFKPRSNAYLDKRGQVADAARNRLDALFGPQLGNFNDHAARPAIPAIQSKEEAAKAALEALFKSPPEK